MSYHMICRPLGMLDTKETGPDPLGILSERMNFPDAKSHSSTMNEL